MVNLLAKKISSFFILKDIIRKEELSVYIYSFEILISTILNSVVIIILTLLTGKIIETIFYLIGFFLLRFVAGGYHAKTHFKCILILIMMYFLFILCIVFVPKEYIQISGFGTIFISICLNLLLAPADNENKPMDDMEKEKFKRLDRIIVFGLSVIVTLMLFNHKTRILAFSLSLGMLTISFSLILSMIQKALKDKSTTK